jgi:hypothetical protein
MPGWDEATKEIAGRTEARSGAEVFRTDINQVIKWSFASCSRLRKSLPLPKQS